jgi:DNA-binding GntR family transcriptional regulator
MTKQEAINILLEHFSEGLVRTIVDAIAEHEREECAKVCENSVEYAGDTLAKAIRARGQQ